MTSPTLAPGRAVARPTAMSYGAAVLVVLLAVVARLALAPVVGASFPFATYLLAIAFTVWRYGFGPSLVALALGLLAVTFFVPTHVLSAIPDKPDLPGLALFVVAGLGLAALGEAMHRATRQAQQSGAAAIHANELLSATLKSIGDAVIVTDIQGRVTFLNPVAESLTGWKQEDAAGMLLDEVFRITNEGSRERVESPLTRVLREGVVVGLANHTILTAKDGRATPIEDSGAPIRTAGDASPAGVILVFRDITERRRAEDAMRASQERFARAFSASPIPMCIVTYAEGRYADVNESFLQNSGYSRQEIVGRTTTEINLYADGGERERLRRILSEQGRVANEEVRRRVKNGEVRIVLMSSEVIDLNGERCILTAINDITERKLTEKAVANLAAIVDSSDDAIIGGTLEGVITSWNKGAESIFGYMRDEVIGRPISLLVPTDRADEPRKILRRLRAGEGIKQYETVRIAKGGKEIDVSLTISPITDTTGAVVGVSTTARDITERKQLEEQLRQSQKMEAIGRLAGGVAHDFNNLLTAILGYSELALHRLQQTDPLRKDIVEIDKAGRRAAALTSQLLAFSRKQILQPQVLSLNTVVGGMEGMLRRLIGEDINLIVDLNPGLGQVKTDPGQIEQVILNLAVNARDSMPSGGALTIETDNVILDEHYASQHPDVEPGPYVLLAVSDTGAGMDKETQARIFEPFFTTKEQGKGTGLGLSTVLGIVKQSGGHIWVYSELKSGSTFKVYLPLIEQAADSAPPHASPPTAARGNETVLLVEDDEGTRNLASRVLEANGYIVLKAGSAARALEICARCDGPIHVVVTDVVMPGMNGRELARTLIHTHPGMRALYMSGYTDNAIVHHGVLDEGADFLQKPFTPEALARKVREVLDR